MKYESITMQEAKDIMGLNFIGPVELNRANFLKEIKYEACNEVPYSKNELEKKRNNYLLIYGSDTLINNNQVTIRNMKEIFGQDPDSLEPCFYNQDWYEKEKFIDDMLEQGWFLIRKTVYSESRAVQPTELMERYVFPTAIKCAYSFFAAWLGLGEKLWYHDFVWCIDTDHNGDRIYVGKYHDIDGVNKNGFSVHRHLGLRDCYGCVDYIT